jgi:hypothetical protein
MSVRIYSKPSRWWRRRHLITITIWPSWLAESLCPHKGDIMICGAFKNRMTGEDNFWGRCPDCQKFVTFEGSYHLGDMVAYNE